MSLPDDGILWALLDSTNTAVNFCLSNSLPISSTCGIEGKSSQSLYDKWIAGCVAASGYTCQVTHMGQHGDQIAITYKLGLPE